MAGCLVGLVQVELLEDTRAQVVRLEGGRACVVERAALPADAREGDVVVDGRVEPEATALRVLEVARRRARLAVPVPPGLEL
ncbi:DUF3006 domain-containing protein [Myxococcus faecalis]|jgi:hypothetical protein|uniref:hypothetical protein n=1 Tax=Myxococcus TaxID=32 RepID=UPI000624CF88|nr:MULTISPECIES: hypothetical protein [Myxococcus]AKF80411.1 hypothetical protein MFUL124B02_12105 [Myxococcus fulvus 124B02]BDT32691.1 DUF3006 domain-containing protein [Myxococcus sp. MH1]MBZ4400549.1 DUF3006 domain-containing protein [Myxococcus sp. AS-1-15]MBZ4412877.1 DUF3006 domain-containing protein [Myxococcus sp. XM-1-1-1]MCK8501289.1 DUF3006 domain-containing protein [Myxococcus fulvus]